MMLWSPKTLSFWLSTIGVPLIACRRTRRIGAILLMAVGWGGAGGVYFRVSERHGVATQPLTVLPHMTRGDWKSLLEHGAFLIPAYIALRNT